MIVHPENDDGHLSFPVGGGEEKKLMLKSIKKTHVTLHKYMP
jgi:hypothetical protein